MQQPEEVRLLEKSLISGPLKEMSPICLQLVSGGKLESLWDDLVHTHHYLGCKKLLGKRLKYMAFIEQTPVAAISWSAPAKKLQVRDDFIGWADQIRRRFLHKLAANSRFVIFPWVQIRHLASHLLGKNLRRLRADWKAWFHQDLWLVETFVDPTRFRGTAYKASNWQHVGTTKGYTKRGKGYMYHGHIKEVFVYVLEPRFRDILGISSTLCVNRTLPKKVEDLRLILHNVAWDPNPLNELNLSEQDVHN